ncbi:MAG: glycosyl transferase [Deltaproteobacteria bacterium]|nr:MAG: glycosyl transferase [Deltaproteobacteria bacterium]RLB38810.1 MAG: glycosyl transferase [Deltaproteobacteria bacterium]
MDSLGAAVTLFLPPWKKGITIQQRLDELSITTPISVKPAQSLHSRWKIWPFIRLHRSILKEADAIYTRSPEVSVALSRAELAHYLELHEIRRLQEKNLLQQIIDNYNKGFIKWILPISTSAAEELKKRGARKERILVNPCGVNIKAFQSVSPLDVSRLAFPRILHAGRIGSNRGLEILKSIARENLGKVLLVGEKDKDFIPNRFVKLLSPVPHRDIPRLYDTSEIVLLPYQKNLATSNVMSPLKLFEAMAAGRPVIASNLPSLREVLKHEVNALLVEPDNIQEWITAVKRLKADTHLAMKLAHALRQEAPKFSWEVRARKIISLIISELSS